MIKISGLYAAFLMISLIFVSGCAGSLYANNSSKMLSGKKWLLLSIYGGNVPENYKISAEFTRNDRNNDQNSETNGTDENSRYMVSGFSGCNSFRAEAAITEGSIRIDHVASTRKACKKPENIMKTESGFLKALESSASYKVSDSSLEIMDASGKTALCFNAGE